MQSEFTTALNGSIDGYLRGLLSLKGNSQQDPVNSFDDLGSYGLLNLYAGIRGTSGNWEVALYAKNIADKLAVTSRTNGAIATPLRGGIPLGGGAVSAGTSSATNYFGITTTEPREFGVNLRFSFGSR